MLQVDLYTSCWSFWRKPFYVLNGIKNDIYLFSTNGPYWLLNNKVYFGTYQSIRHWEIKLFVSDVCATSSEIKHRGKKLHSTPSHQLLHWGSNIPLAQYHFPDNNQTCLFNVTHEKHKWLSTSTHYFTDDMFVGTVSLFGIKSVLSEKVAQITIDENQIHLLPYILGATILTQIRT